MIAELCQLSLMIALAISLVQSGLLLVGAHTGNLAYQAIGRPAVYCVAGLIFLAFGGLMYSFLVDDFSVLYVASNSNSLLPLQYKIAAVWGGHEGSMLLWLFMLSVWMLLVATFSKNLPLTFLSRVLGVMGLIAAGLLIFILFSSNPFERLIPAVSEGRDLNPLLQDPGMVSHPPMLYMGYVGFSVAFSFAIAALLGGKLDADWARWSRPWTVAAWSFLTLGICLGSLWAYYVLGWGGWWFWDPVENASFMPWLLGTALIHSLAVTEKRNTFKLWTVLLAIFAFSLSLLGTFLVRSGVLSSVHAFATDPRRGLFILAFLVCVIGSSLTLFAIRAPKVGWGGRFGLFSRESLLLTNNVLLLVAAASVLLGTLYPLLLDGLGLGKVSVGPPYFNSVFVPLLTPALFLTGIGPVARWKAASLPEVGARLKWAAIICLVTTIITVWQHRNISAFAAFGFFLGFWVVASSVTALWQRIRPAKGDSLLQRIRKPAGSFYGMLFAHLGLGIFIIGVVGVKALETEKDVQMKVGDTVTIGQNVFTFHGVNEVAGPNYQAVRGDFSVANGAEPVARLYPEKRDYLSGGNTMTQAAIHTGLFRDLYVSLGEPIDQNTWIVRVYDKPLVDWIWAGCILMAIGGGCSVLDRRYRISAKKNVEHAQCD